MPSSIPYHHPSLVLGKIVDTKVLDNLKEINKCQQNIDAAQERLNSLIMMKRSITMTINELKDMNVEMPDVEKKQTDIQVNLFICLFPPNH
jgi:ACT domain-containing protein